MKLRKRTNYKSIIPLKFLPALICTGGAIVSLVSLVLISRVNQWTLLPEEQVLYDKIQNLCVIVLIDCTLIGSILGLYFKISRRFKSPYKYFYSSGFEFLLEKTGYVLFIDEKYMLIPSIDFYENEKAQIILEMEVLSGKLQLGIELIEEINSYLGQQNSEYRIVDGYLNEGYLTYVLALNFRNERLTL